MFIDKHFLFEVNFKQNATGWVKFIVEICLKAENALNRNSYEIY